MATIIRSRKTILLIALFCIQLGALAAGNVDRPFSLQAELLQQQITRYANIQQKGGWLKIILDKKQYKKGESSAVIRQVKQRLHATGDLAATDTSQLFTPGLEDAIRKVQHQFGYKESGLIDALLIMRLNIPVSQRIQQLQVNLERVRTMQAAAEGRRIVVNIPEYKLHVYEGSTHVFDMNVVVGTKKKTGRQFLMMK